MDSYDDITRVNSHTITVNHTTKKSIESTSDNEQALSLPATSSISYHEQVAITLQVWIDPFAYSVLGMIGLFVFYLHPFGDVARSLPLFLSINALAFIFSTRMVPDSWKVLLHPILVTSIITCLLVWALGATIGLSINQTLMFYATSTEYTELFRPDAWNDGRRGPGAGDVLTSILNAGIVSFPFYRSTSIVSSPIYVALAFPLYQCRRDLKENALQMLCIIFPNIVLSLFFWPLIPGGLVMGLPWESAVPFAGRFMSTPLAIELVKTAGGDEGLTVVLVVVTGIAVVLTKDHLFRWMKVRADDPMTIGLIVGILGGAIGTSSLMKSNPRAMASATVGFVGYGLIMLCLIAVSPISKIVRTIAGG